MSRQLEAVQEQRRQKRNAAILLAVEGGLEDAVSAQGGELTGFTVRLRGGDVLMVVKAEFEGEPMVGFVGSADLASCLIKADKELVGNKVGWRPDKF